MVNYEKKNLFRYVFIVMLIYIGLKIWFRIYRKAGTDINVHTPISSCQTTKKIFYLKTHKTASSSIFNILARYAIKNNLKVNLPGNPNLSNFWSISLKKENIDLASFPPDIHLMHYRLNVDDTLKIFPKHETIFITILRNTTSQYESTFRYFGLGYLKHLNTHLTIDRYMEFIKNIPKHKKLPSFSRNPMFADLGYDTSKLLKTEDIKKAINEIDNLFDIVMITELWEESLILLKRKLCLSLSEIVVLNVNEDLFKNKRQIKGYDSLIMDFNQADNLLYSHFYKKLKRISKSISLKEIQELRHLQKMWENVCISGRIPKIAYGSKLYLGYSLKPNISKTYESTCVFLTLSELEYVNKFRLSLHNRNYTQNYV